MNYTREQEQGFLKQGLSIKGFKKCHPECPGTECDDLFCYGTRKAKRLKRDLEISRSLEMLDKFKIGFKDSNIPNVVIIDLKYSEFYLSLRSFYIRKPGSNKWIHKKMYFVCTPNGLWRYYGKTLQEIMENTDTFIHPKLFFSLGKDYIIKEGAKEIKAEKNTTKAKTKKVIDPIIIKCSIDRLLDSLEL